MSVGFHNVLINYKNKLKWLMMSPELRAALYFLQLCSIPHRILLLSTWICRSHWKDKTILVDFFVLFYFPSFGCFLVLSPSSSYENSSLYEDVLKKIIAATDVFIHWETEEKYSFQISSNLGEVQIFLGS